MGLSDNWPRLVVRHHHNDSRYVPRGPDASPHLKEWMPSFSDATDTLNNKYPATPPVYAYFSNIIRIPPTQRKRSIDAGFALWV